MGADHNFFNTEWTPGLSAAPSFDDWGGTRDRTCGSQNPSRLSAAQQRKVGRAYIAGAVHLFADDDDSVLPMFDGSPVAVPSAGDADVRSHAIGGGLRHRAARASTADVSAGATAAVRLCVGVSDSATTTACQKQAQLGTGTALAERRSSPASRSGSSSTSDGRRPGQQGGSTSTEPWDLSADSRLDLRTIVDPRRGPVQLCVSS